MLVRRLAVDSLTLGTKMKSRFIDVDCSALIEDFLEGWPEFRPGHGGGRRANSFIPTRRSLPKGLQLRHGPRV